ncbi:ParB N-terminal domain-containing protein [Leptospira sp. 201903070]|jgi:ParB family transcriptional regulator, chromosome partitioning protein|uniref:ParB N-terminal domain-containing protein n=1 Tax=Leptospira ainlahdjerensis TaxID=2810033 RepID=A0ABS2UC15_9LEPT|nr:ParB N-terminal domain-containing protein [Leptospira ainlahdjerensis]MBM9577916.1 ParB N-terminal domain-containing protein [Leptospira ainlahdjerensis]
MKIRVSDIKVKNRIRKDLGDLRPLKESIQKLGLLHPILIDLDNTLISGERRLESVKLLGWEYVDVRIVDIRNKKERVQMEAEENNIRLEFTSEEQERVQELLKRYSYSTIFGRILAWILDLWDWIKRFFQKN